jgi:hypothetical protein
VIAAVAVTVHQPYSFGPAIRSDGLGYHSWTRALLDGHLSFCEYQELQVVQAIPSAAASGRCANKYAPGLALLRFPLMAPFALANGGQLRSGAEDIVNQITGILAGAVAVTSVIVAGRKLGARSWIANAAAVVLAFGTGLFDYATLDSSFTHVYSAAFVGLLVVYGVDRLLRPRADRPTTTGEFARDTLIVFGLGAALVAIRLPSALVLVALAAAALVVVRVRDLGRRVAAPILLGTGGALAAVVLGALAYNRYIFARWTLSSYGDEPFLLTRFKQLAVLASIQKGFVTWYPVVVVVVLVAIAARNWSGLGLLAGVTTPLVILYGAWHSWDLAGGFGHRGFVEIVPVYGVVLACSAERLSRAWRSATFVLAGAAMLMTLGIMAAYWNYEIGFYGIDGQQWLRHAVGSESFPVVVYRWFASW